MYTYIVHNIQFIHRNPDEHENEVRSIKYEVIDANMVLESINKMSKN